MRDYTDYHPKYNDVLLDSGRHIYNMQLQTFEGREVDIDGIKTKALVRYHQSPINEFAENRKITVWNDVPIQQGSVVTTLDDDRVFLVVSHVNQNPLHKYGLIREINLYLNWFDNEGNLQIAPAIVHAKTLYTTGVKNEGRMQIPNGMVGILLPYNEHTAKLNRNHRFVFNKTRYKLTFYNEIEDIGLIALICEEDIPTAYDDINNNLANRWRSDGFDRLREKDKERLSLYGVPNSGFVDVDEDIEGESIIEEPETEPEDTASKYSIKIHSESAPKISVWDKTKITTNTPIDEIKDWAIVGNSYLRLIQTKDKQTVYVEPINMKASGKARVMVQTTGGEIIETTIDVRNI